MAGWKDVLGQVAPTIAQALGGPLAGGVVRKLAGVLLGNEKASETQVAEAVLKADPATFLKLKELEQEYAKFVLDHELNLEKLGVEDRDSARKREVAVKDWIPAVLALGLNGAFFSLMFLMFKQKIPAENRDAFTLLLGMLSGGVTSVLSYYFGSSSGSARKTELMGK
jgi:hypothetical protein